VGGRLGFVLLVVSVFCNAATYHLQSYAMQLGATKAMTVVVNCFLATAYFVLGGFLWRRMGWSGWGMEQVRVTSMLAWIRQRPIPVIAATAAGGGAAFLIVLSISRFGSEVTAFLANQTLVFMVLGGLLVGERIRAIEAAVMVIILAGALMFSYRSGGEFRLEAWAIMAAACVGVAAKQLIVRRSADTSPLCLVMAAMLFSMGLFTTAIGLWQGELAGMPAAAMGVLALSTLLGSVVGMLLLYAGYGLVGVCRGSPVDAMRPLGVLLIGLALGHALPSGLQWLGAVMVLGGTAALARLHRPGSSRAMGAAVTAPAAARGI